MRHFWLALLAGVVSLNVVCAVEKNDKCKKKKHADTLIDDSCECKKKKEGNFDF